MVSLTCADSSPPHGISQIYEAISFEAMSFFCLVETLDIGEPISRVFRGKCSGSRMRSSGRGGWQVDTFFVMTKLVPVQ